MQGKPEQGDPSTIVPRHRRSCHYRSIMSRRTSEEKASTARPQPGESVIALYIAAGWAGCWLLGQARTSALSAGRLQHSAGCAIEFLLFGVSACNSIEPTQQGCTLRQPGPLTTSFPR